MDPTALQILSIKFIDLPLTQQPHHLHCRHEQLLIRFQIPLQYMNILPISAIKGLFQVSMEEEL